MSERKIRSDKKITVQTRLTKFEKVLFNRFKLWMNFKTDLETVNHCLCKGLEEGNDTYIDDDEIVAVKSRLVADKDTVLVNGRIDSDSNYTFKYIQAEFNLNQRQLLIILIDRIMQRNGFIK